ncbi:hypothetical protein GTW43_25740 [Streptomyces sp. SID5785]|uniref:hypothetical protein n=1 Tax=Streptomyces sp. SID5785 TaxID=2690309 RepID=UPI001360D03C|nr:hypothetical protein [Streptomyces sp. SID5785]MZD04677.1 hypothetical protein [Streptomyces sp. SID5785]MZD08454.1 hypothetical protein [Streptomyces sp. SID5785]
MPVRVRSPLVTAIVTGVLAALALGAAGTTARGVAEEAAPPVAPAADLPHLSTVHEHAASGAHASSDGR